MNLTSSVMNKLFPRTNATALLSASPLLKSTGGSMPPPALPTPTLQPQAEETTPEQDADGQPLHDAQDSIPEETEAEVAAETPTEATSETLPQVSEDGVIQSEVNSADASTEAQPEPSESESFDTQQPSITSFEMEEVVVESTAIVTQSVEVPEGTEGAGETMPESKEDPEPSQEEAEEKRLQEEAEEKRLQEEAEEKRLQDEAEEKRLQDEAEEKRLQEEAEAKRLQEEAEAAAAAKKKQAEEAAAAKKKQAAEAAAAAKKKQAAEIAAAAASKKKQEAAAAAAAAAAAKKKQAEAAAAAAAASAKKKQAEEAAAAKKKVETKKPVPVSAPVSSLTTSKVPPVKSAAKLDSKTDSSSTTGTSSSTSSSRIPHTIYPEPSPTLVLGEPLVSNRTLTILKFLELTSNANIPHDSKDLAEVGAGNLPHLLKMVTIQTEALQNGAPSGYPEGDSVKVRLIRSDPFQHPWSTLRGVILSLYDQLILREAYPESRAEWNVLAETIHMMLIHTETLLNKIQPLVQKCLDEEEQSMSPCVREYLEQVRDALRSEAGSSRLPCMEQVESIQEERDYEEADYSPSRAQVMMRLEEYSDSDQEEDLLRKEE